MNTYQKEDTFRDEIISNKRMQYFNLFLFFYFQMGISILAYIATFSVFFFFFREATFSQ